jgi:hypothetical protein
VTTTTSENSNGNGNGSGLSPTMRFVAQIGVPAAIALYLTWMLSGRLDGMLNALDQKVNSHSVESIEQGQTLREIRDLMRMQVDIDRLGCVEQAKGDRQKISDCFNPPHRER